jgi:hypothetical protein
MLETKDHWHDGLSTKFSEHSVHVGCYYCRAQELGRTNCPNSSHTTTQQTL